MSNPNSQKAKLIARLQTYVPLYEWPLLDELAESGGPSEPEAMWERFIAHLNAVEPIICKKADGPVPHASLLGSIEKYREIFIQSNAAPQVSLPARMGGPGQNVEADGRTAPNNRLGVRGDTAEGETRPHEPVTRHAESRSATNDQQGFLNPAAAAPQPEAGKDDTRRMDWLEDIAKVYWVTVQTQPHGEHIFAGQGKALREAIDDDMAKRSATLDGGKNG